MAKRNLTAPTTRAPNLCTTVVIKKTNRTEGMSYVAEQLCLIWKDNMAVREHSSEAIPRQSTGHRIKHGNDNHDLRECTTAALN